MPPWQVKACSRLGIVVGQALDIQIDGRAFDLEFRTAGDMDFPSANRRRLDS